MLENLQKNDILLNDSDFLYEFLILVHSLIFENQALQIVQVIMSCLDIMNLKSDVSNTFHLSVVYSHIGNILFRHKLINSCLDFKRIAFEHMKKVSPSSSKFPSFFKPIKNIEHLYGILSFLGVGLILKN